MMLIDVETENLHIARIKAREGKCNGHKYQDIVHAILEEHLPRNMELEDDGHPAYSRLGTDLKIRVHSIGTFGFELKQDRDAQMGSTSASYADGKFELTTPDKYDSILRTLFMDMLKGREPQLQALLRFLDCSGFPCMTRYSAWEAARRAKLVKACNARASHDLTFMQEHYRAKNVQYIQIGQAGLFYLTENPLNFPIPQLSGEFRMELRAGACGSVINKTTGIRMRGASLRLTGRLLGPVASPYSLDQPDDIKELFGCSKF